MRVLSKEDMEYNVVALMQSARQSREWALDALTAVKERHWLRVEHALTQSQLAFSQTETIQRCLADQEKPENISLGLVDSNVADNLRQTTLLREMIEDLRVIQRVQHQGRNK